jgi:hypothetical protein
MERYGPIYPLFSLSKVKTLQSAFPDRSWRFNATVYYPIFYTAIKPARQIPKTVVIEFNLFIINVMRHCSLNCRTCLSNFLNSASTVSWTLEFSRIALRNDTKHSQAFPRIDCNPREISTRTGSNQIQIADSLSQKWGISPIPPNSLRRRRATFRAADGS